MSLCELVLFGLGGGVIAWMVSNWMSDWKVFRRSYGRVIHLHRPFGWFWGQDDWDRRYGIRHWGFWFTEPGP